MKSLIGEPKPLLMSIFIKDKVNTLPELEATKILSVF